MSCTHKKKRINNNKEKNKITENRHNEMVAEDILMALSGHVVFTNACTDALTCMHTYAYTHAHTCIIHMHVHVHAHTRTLRTSFAGIGSAKQSEHSLGIWAFKLA